YAWPGNVRELRNVLERALLFADGGEIGVDQLPPLANAAPPAARAQLSDDALAGIAAGFRGTRQELARHLGLAERTLYRRLKALKLT
ncbi:MAG TPA: helix-turn-helix domain-containing protein, partial [Telluria sp.]|nr:helix-turn-helix domain-containing protein [Telluria sp.]